MRPAVTAGRASAAKPSSAPGGDHRRRVQVELETGDLAVPEGPDVGLVLDHLLARVADRRLGVDEGHDLVALGDELARLEDLEVAVPAERAEPRQHGVLAAVG